MLAPARMLEPRSVGRGQVPAGAWMAGAGFLAAVVGLGAYLRAREDEGSFDVPPSSASRPGLRRFFDFGEKGWSEDGINQRPYDGP